MLTRSTLLLLALAACSGDKDETDTPSTELSGCDPLDTALCAFPWPSSYYQVEADTETGVKNRFFPESFPINIDATRIKGDMLERFDGFSTGSMMLAYFEGATGEGLISLTDIDAYMDPGALTVIIDTKTGQRVPHYAEIDHTTDIPGERALILWPAVPLANATRYVVGIRGMKNASGALIPVSDGFATLRDGAETSDPDLTFRQARFEDEVFGVLADQGFARADLQLAWDFTTVSQDSTIGRMIHMRDDFLSDLPAAGPAYTITKVDDYDCAVEGTHIGREVQGSLKTPLYTTADTADVFLTVGEDGMPFRNGESTSEFLIRIPCSVIADPRAARVVQYGHGLLGDRTEARTGHLGDFQDRAGFIVFAQDWKGMSARDYAAISAMIALDPGRFPILPERAMQGFVDMMGGTRLIAGALADDDALKVEGVSLIDPEKIDYYGISQGGIMGAAFMGVSPDVQRGVLGVPGGPYSLLLPRSADFDTFFRIFQTFFADHREIMLLIGAMQTPWDVAEPMGWLQNTTANSVSGAPKQLLLQSAIGDAQVSTLGAQMMARGYGATTLAPETRPVWGLDEASGPSEGSVLVEWLYTDGSLEPIENVPPEKSGDTHECVRREQAAQDQIWDFFESGQIVNHCDGACISERAGLCD